jgi:hypothetical protein
VRLSRRQFIAVTAGAAAGAAIPEAVMKWAGQMAAATADQSGFFLSPLQMRTCEAACARLVPTGADPTTDPGAAEAHAAIFIDRFLASFQPELSTVADNPDIWLHGRFSGRNQYPNNDTGQPSGTYPADDLLNTSGQMQLLQLSPVQERAWRVRLYGASALDGASSKWAQQVNSGTIPGLVPGGLRQLYQDGLDAFDSWSMQITMQPFASASPNEQDLMLAVAGNVVIDGIGPNLPALAPLPPPAAEALFPTLLRDTFAACYGLPEYRGLHSNPLWQMIGYDGDTQPLGNSIYGKDLPGDNDGYGDGIYTLEGGYNEYRPVSYPDPDSTIMTPAEINQLMSLLAQKEQSR